MRSVLLLLCGLFCAWMETGPLANAASADVPNASAPAAASTPAKTLRVATVQMRSSKNLEENLARTVRFIEGAAKDGARVVVFPECSVTGYFEEVIKATDADTLRRAEERIAAACRKTGIYAIVGMPVRDKGKLFNSAIVISPEGAVIERYHKMQLAEGWPDAGDHLSIYKIDGVWCTTIVCHDERYPELVRLPVLAGAQVVFYISHESGLREERKIDPYRAQIQARAVENGVFVVHANPPANEDASGSHGQSRAISPQGNIIQEASIFEEDVITVDLEIRRATRSNATNAFNSELLGPWWREGLKLVRKIE